MKCLRFSRASLAFLVPGILLLVTMTAAAKNGRDFAGYYSLSNVVEQGNEMVVTLQVQLFNHSDADLKGAVVTLRGSHPAPSPLGAFQPVKLWRNRGEVRLIRQLAVPRDEFERWHNGSQPALFVVYSDVNGRRWERYVQLSSRPARP